MSSANFCDLTAVAGVSPHPGASRRPSPAEWERGERAAVVAEARSWIGTPYHHAADVKGAGVDCAMILVRVFCDLALVEPFDPRPYTRDWMLHRDDERYLGFLLARAREVAAPDPGDVILFRFGRCFAHGGIVTASAPLTVVHAFAPARVVLEEEVARNAELAERLKRAKFASYWGRNA
jgi:NlpC/P60 family putative phage cell wall peptidase